MNRKQAEERALSHARGYNQIHYLVKTTRGYIVLNDFEMDINAIHDRYIQTIVYPCGMIEPYLHFSILDVD